MCFMFPRLHALWPDGKWWAFTLYKNRTRTLYTYDLMKCNFMDETRCPRFFCIYFLFVHCQLWHSIWIITWNQRLLKTRGQIFSRCSFPSNSSIWCVAKFKGVSMDLKKSLFKCEKKSQYTCLTNTSLFLYCKCTSVHDNLSTPSPDFITLLWWCVHDHLIFSSQQHRHWSFEQGEHLFHLFCHFIKTLILLEESLNHLQLPCFI